jgi:1,4-alpha-glucan branching enzyme
VTAPSAALALVLHAHLPWVRHDDHDALEERWLFEAITECYLPLLAVCDGLARDGVPGSLALSLSPTLLTMLRDAALRARFEKHFAKLSATLNAAQRRLDARFRPALGHHARRLDAAWATWSRLHGDLPAAFDAHRRTGRLSLWTSAAPHPLLPLWADRRWFLDLALDRAISLHRNVFGDSRRGALAARVRGRAGGARGPRGPRGEGLGARDPRGAARRAAPHPRDRLARARPLGGGLRGA